MTLEFKILWLFMKNKWWLISRTTQNTTSKQKFPHISSYPQRNRSLENAFIASENAVNDQYFHDVVIQNFEVIYEEQVMAHIQKDRRHEFET
jgi:hypothetical protein